MSEPTTEVTPDGTPGTKPDDITLGVKPDAKPDEKPVDTADDSALGDAGKKALTEERTARKTAEKKATELEAENARLRRTNAASKGTDLDAIKAEMRAEFADQLAATAIKAEAKGRLTDPADTARYPEYFKDVDASDEAAVTAAVDKLLTDKPYLSATPSGPQPWGDVGGGQRSSTESEPSTPEERMRRAYGSKSN